MEKDKHIDISVSNELVRNLDKISKNKQEIITSINVNEKERGKIENDIRILNERLSKITDIICSQYNEKEGYEKILEETSSAYSKIRDSSQHLLNKLKEATS